MIRVLFIKILMMVFGGVEVGKGDKLGDNGIGGG